MGGIKTKWGGALQAHLPAKCFQARGVAQMMVEKEAATSREKRTR